MMMMILNISFRQVLNSGWLNRRVASTSMNRESSRSHAVFTVALESKVGEFNINYTYNPLGLDCSNTVGTSGMLAKLSFTVVHRSLSSQESSLSEVLSFKYEMICFY